MQELWRSGTGVKPLGNRGRTGVGARRKGGGRGRNYIIGRGK